MFKFSDARNILKSSLYFLSLCFPVFVRQIARYHPRKNRKYIWKKFSKLTRVKFKQVLNSLFREEKLNRS